MVKKKRKKQRFSKKMQIKLMAIFAFVLIVLVGLNIRIAYIMAKSGDQYAKKVLSQQEYDSQTLPYQRGEIQDRNGNVLAKSEKVYNVILDCYAVNGDEEYIEPTIRALTSTLDLSEEDVRGRLTSEETKDSQYQVLKKKISKEEKEVFEEYASTAADKELTSEQRKEKENIKGVWFEEQYDRKYPMGTLAANIIGFSNDYDDGIVGLEQYYSDVLNGTNGREFGYLNEDSEMERTFIEPEDGNSLVTTLDVNIQEIIDKYIAAFDAEYSGGPNESAQGTGSKTTAVIVGNPNTGEIYGMSTNRGFDLNDPHNLDAWYTEEAQNAMTEEEKVEALNTMWNNYCVSEAFEPGSTFKPVTVSAALETGAITEDTEFVCDGGEYVTDTQINCDNVNGHGSETTKEAIKNSCNDALMQIGYKLGINSFCKYQRIFNFGSLTGIDLPNENTGSLYTENNMHEVELATNTFGQGFTCTMVQEFAAFCAVVNGGYYYRPHVVKQVLDSNGGVAKNIEPLLLSQPISGKTSSILKEALEMGVKEGTGKKAQVPGYRIGGKTGTAEKIPRDQGNYVVSFIGCAPADNPEVAIYVVIDEPNVEDQASGGYAHIIARKILTEVLPYLGIYQTEEITDEVLYNLEMTREEAEAGRQVEKNETAETDEEGNPVETQETDENGNPIDNGTDESWNLGDPEDPVAANPNVADPPTNTADETPETPESGVTNEDLEIE